MMEFGELKRILAAFEREGVRYVLVGRPLDPENLRIACGLSSLELLAPVRRTPGVRKFHSIEEMSKERDRRDRDQTPKGPESP